MNDFGEIVADDGDVRRQAEDWAYGEVGGGRSPEEVAADLATSGWSSEDAEAIAELARQRTRHLRGVVTRSDVSLHAEKRYRTAIQNNPMLATGRANSGGLVGLLWRFFTNRNARPKSNRGRHNGPFKPDT